MKTTTEVQHQKTVITPSELIKHWQGHRNLTRRVIEAFPEKALFSHTIGGMRTFADMTKELLGIAAPGLREIATGESVPLDEHFKEADTKTRLLDLWDDSTEKINMYWARIPAERFQEQIKLFGQYEGTVLSSILYFIDNEIHHRGQGYVYLRSLEVEPPAFWDR